MIKTQTKFKSTAAEKRWIDLQKEKALLQAKKPTPVIQEKIDIINSLMTSCKVGFNLAEAKVKKISKFLKEATGVEKVRYAVLPDGVIPKYVLFKEIVVLYVEKDGLIFFKENKA